MVVRELRVAPADQRVNDVVETIQHLDTTDKLPKPVMDLGKLSQQTPCDLVSTMLRKVWLCDCGMIVDVILARL